MTNQSLVGRSIGLIGVVLLVTSVGAQSPATFESVQRYTYRLNGPALELSLPYQFEVRPGSRPGEVFQAWGKTRYPSVSLWVGQPKGTLEQQCAEARKTLGNNVRPVSQSRETVDGRPAVIAFARWTAPLGAGTELQTMLLCVHEGGKAIVVTATDGAPDTGFDARLAETVQSLKLGKS